MALISLGWCWATRRLSRKCTLENAQRPHGEPALGVGDVQLHAQTVDRGFELAVLAKERPLSADARLVLPGHRIASSESLVSDIILPVYIQDVNSLNACLVICRGEQRVSRFDQ